MTPFIHMHPDSKAGARPTDADATDYITAGILL